MNYSGYTWDTQCDSIIRRNHLDSVQYLKTLNYTSNDSVIVLLYSTNKVNHLLFYNQFSNTKLTEFEFQPPIHENTFGFDLSPDDSKLLVIGESLGIYMYGVNLQPSAKKDEGTPQSIVQINPNPTSDFLEISYSPYINRMVNHTVDGIAIYDVFGEKLVSSSHYSIITTQYSVKLDVSGLPAGVYFVKVGEKVGKFIKIEN